MKNNKWLILFLILLLVLQNNGSILNVEHDEPINEKVKDIEESERVANESEIKLKGWGFFNLKPTNKPLVNQADVDSYMSQEYGPFDRHPCRRVCNGQSMTCYYRLALHHYQRFGNTCQRCQIDAAACEAERCVYGDGVRSSIMAVNYLSPGPAMELCEKDVVVVDVMNYLNEPTTLHWHGLHMSQTPEMDGGPYITQYPSDAYLHNYHVHREMDVLVDLLLKLHQKVFSIFQHEY